MVFTNDVLRHFDNYFRTPLLITDFDNFIVFKHRVNEQMASYFDGTHQNQKRYMWCDNSINYADVMHHTNWFKVCTNFTSSFSTQIYEIEADFHVSYHDLRSQHHNQVQIRSDHRRQYFQFLEHDHRHKQRQSFHQFTAIWQQMVLNQNEVTLDVTDVFKQIYLIGFNFHYIIEIFVIFVVYRIDFYRLSDFIKIDLFTLDVIAMRQMHIDFHVFVVNFDDRQVNSLLIVYRFVGPIVRSSWLSPFPLNFSANEKQNPRE